jgi:anionic cell wall polymer biosynthesis LytR-Cps2A-Psr (LCP) family protein
MRTRNFVKAAVIFLGVVLVLLGVYYAGRWLERRAFPTAGIRGDPALLQAEERLVTYQDKTYAYRKGLTSILLMGVDRSSESAQQTTGFRSGGQSDFMLLMVIDRDRKAVYRIHIDRDVMTPITILGVLGKPSGTRVAQICLSHGFGDGKAMSCELAVQAASTLLLGVDIDFYVALELDAIPILNEAVGGVTVEIEDDYTAFDADMYPGATVTLHGDEAEMFVRWRLPIGDGTNESRMRRQRAYMSSFAAQLESYLKGSVNYIGTLYDMLSGRFVTDLSRGRMINEANRAIAYTVYPTRTLEGEHVIGESGFMEFYANEAALEQLVLELFYNVKE